MSVVPTLLYSTPEEPAARGQHVTRDKGYCCTGLLEKLTAAQLISKLLAFYTT